MTRGSRAGAAVMVEALVGGARVGGRQCSRWSCGRRQPMFEAELGSQDNAQDGTNRRKCKRKRSTKGNIPFYGIPPLCSKHAKSGTMTLSSTILLNSHLIVKSLCCKEMDRNYLKYIFNRKGDIRKRVNIF
jgi:hypothetical protein